MARRRNLNHNITHREATMTRIKWRTQNDTDDEREKHKAPTRYVETMESLTDQQYTEDADLNVIAARAGYTNGSNANIAQVAQALGIQPITAEQLQDMTDKPELRDILDIQLRGKQVWDQMPANVKERFQGSVLKFLEFIQNGDIDEGERLGLWQKQKPPKEPKPREYTQDEINQFRQAMGLDPVTKKTPK